MRIEVSEEEEPQATPMEIYFRISGSHHDEDNNMTITGRYKDGSIVVNAPADRSAIALASLVVNLETGDVSTTTSEYDDEPYSTIIHDQLIDAPPSDSSNKFTPPTYTSGQINDRFQQIIEDTET